VAGAGAVDACGVRALGVYAATITPAATAVGTGLAMHRPWLALEALVLVASFAIGAFIAATLQLRGSTRAVLASPLLAEARRELLDDARDGHPERVVDAHAGRRDPHDACHEPVDGCGPRSGD